MQYLRERYYNQNLGRFNRADSFEGFQNIPLSRNQYIYGNGNPVSFSDPSGQVSAVEFFADPIADAFLRFAPPLLQASSAISQLGVLQSVLWIPIAAIVGVNAALAISARLRNGKIWDGTLTGAKVSVSKWSASSLHQYTSSLARYNLEAKTDTFAGEWLFLLSGVGLKDTFPDIFSENLPSEGLNPYSVMNSKTVRLYTPSILPANEASFFGAVVFLSLGTGTPDLKKGIAYEAFIAGSGFGELVDKDFGPFIRTSSSRFASLSGLVGLSIYLPPALLGSK